MRKMVGMLALAAVLALSACGNGDGAEEITVELSEFVVNVDSSSISDGEAEFTIENVGAFPHNLVVARTDLAAGSLPLAEAGGVDESQLDVVGGVAPFEPGTESLELELASGNYVLFCNVTFEPAAFALFT